MPDGRRNLKQLARLALGDGLAGGQIKLHLSAGVFWTMRDQAQAPTAHARRVNILSLSRTSQHKDPKKLMRYYRETST